MRNPRPSVRERLQAIAQGRAGKPSGSSLVDLGVADKHRADFEAWDRFAALTNGEPIPAPADLLTPLP